MDYKNDFFTAYREYLKIPEVRDAHDRILGMFVEMLDPMAECDFTDMGCGTSEFGRFCCENLDTKYVGFDLDISRVEVDDLWGQCKFVVGDYTEAMPSPDDLVVSLFATEIHLPWAEHEGLYKKWFDHGVKGLLVAGFYYDKAPEEAKIVEYNGYEVYQTRRSQPLLLNEVRILQQVPAGMFVDNFVEVWRILTPACYA